MRVLEQLMSARLRRALRGREDHAAQVSVAAVSSRRDPDHVRLYWADVATPAQSGYLGEIRREAALQIVPALFDEIRAWRKHCHAGSAAAAGGAL